MGGALKTRIIRKGFTQEVGAILGRMTSVCKSQAIGENITGMGLTLLELLYKDTERTTVGQKWIKIVIFALITLLLIFIRIPASHFI